MDIDEQIAKSRCYVCGARIILLPSGRFAVFDIRYQLVGIVDSLHETLDFIRQASIVPDPAPARQASRSKARFTLEDLGL